MRPLGGTISRPICTLAPPLALPKLPTLLNASAPPVLVAKNRTKINGSFLLLSSSSPEPHGTSKAWLGPARQLTRYSIVEDERETRVSLDIGKAMRRFSWPTLRTDVASLGVLRNIDFTLKPHLNEMLNGCLLTPKGVQGLFRADVVAEQDVIAKFMFPHKASFNASFAHGVLFLEDSEEILKTDHRGVDRSYVDRRGIQINLGFSRACTKPYSPWREHDGRVRHTFHAVVARSLGGLNLLMSDTVDCVRRQYRGNPGSYMNLVTRQLQNDQYLIRPKKWKKWYFRAHLMGVPSLFLGLVDEAGVLRGTHRIETQAIPRASADADGGKQWDPEENMRWAARVLATLRDYCQEAADLAEVANTRWALQRALWRVEISPVGGEVRVLVRELTREERRGVTLVPTAVLEAFKKSYGI
ncbi:hypothetical protein K438DRAFT_1016627 [Mycena galopus ATCC 62051]|nr:hypothetical protein K438DRAFT_1016627 [Mycena galopus ATCC 62051]